MNRLTLEQQLRDQAMAANEPFSQPLHDRVMRQVRTIRRQASPSELPSRFFFGSLTALATAAIIAFTIFALRPAAPTAMPGPRAAVPDMAAINQWFAQATQPVQRSLDNSLAAGDLSGLDRDARNLGQFMIRQLDCFPQPE